MPQLFGVLLNPNQVQKKPLFGRGIASLTYPDDTAPVAVDGPITAWRAWRLTTDDRLASLTNRPRPNFGPFVYDGPTARFSDNPHKMLRAAGLDGLWSFNYPTFLDRIVEAYGENIAIYAERFPLVFGSITIFGRVVEYTEGYRSEWLTIKRLGAHSLLQRQRLNVAKLESRYQCEVLVSANLDNLWGKL